MQTDRVMLRGLVRVIALQCEPSSELWRVHEL